MPKTPNECIFEDDTMSMMKCHDGYWLHDTAIGWNVAMRAKTEQAAWIESIHYHQKRLFETKTALVAAQANLDAILGILDAEVKEPDANDTGWR